MAAMTKALFLLSIIVSLSSAQRPGSFDVFTCDESKPSLVKLHSFDYTPKPLTFPTTITINAKVEILQDLVAPVSMDTVMNARVGEQSNYITVPCVEGVGSCHTVDLCESLSGQNCPLLLTDADNTCSCPIFKGNITLDNYELPLPISGDRSFGYSLETRVYTQGVFALCFVTELEVE